ncbi:16S rRNA (cytosine(1402)-N(4))-methyltransferase [Nocardioides silvaticus]|uniref:Ribosomal RNA small subunit methyltransferase H n=1 Tax=Nocardioides silvaticus TaxID=2201891 RepID=A0A316TN25_9ACTN|nr:16S rRNA (cytosine(1402)-N(4))-methyltransferase RsmH [Nocardioides silvaticus]PWN03574.1 16S rRNA (cytosine(1402)-N(4))-methyltransferase [Nocardioides silvaticus]
MDNPRHVPVLLDRVVALLAPALDHDDAVLVDATLGLGGHSEAVLARCELARVVGIDRDPDALELSRERLAPYGDRFTAVHAVYDEIPDVLADLGLAGDRGVDGVLFDLGVSSMQLDLPERGFAYAVDAPLDMRMSSGTGPTAADVLNTYDAPDLARVLKEYGEERMARRIAEAIVRERAKEPFTTSGRLVALLYDVIPAPARRTGGHPAKRTFQALRMEVNDELRVLERAVPAAIDAIGVGGRVVVESYHSLEDRLVKRAFAAATSSDVPEDLPFVPEGHEPALRLVTRGAEQADADEIALNPRAASVRLRAVERVRPRTTGKGAA